MMKSKTKKKIFIEIFSDNNFLFKIFSTIKIKLEKIHSLQLIIKTFHIYKEKRGKMNFYMKGIIDNFSY